jgi:L-amino acid N-acyltransferase YncA
VNTPLLAAYAAARRFPNACRRGASKLVLQALITTCEQSGFWKLVSRVFPENMTSRRSIGSLGFREVGVYKKHGQLDGAWRGVIIVERLLGEWSS